MKSSHWIKAAAAALVLAAAPLAWTAPIPAEKSPLGWIPADAPLVIHLNGVETLRDHAVAFLKNAVPDRAEMVQQQSDMFLKEGIAGRKLRGVAKDGPIFVVFTEMPKPGDARPSMAIVVAVTDYTEFQDNILTNGEKKTLKTGPGYDSFTAEGSGENVFLVNQKEYAVVTPSKEAAALFAQKRTDAPRLDAKMSKAQAAKLHREDRQVRQEQRHMASRNGGHITKQEQRTLNQQENAISKQIGK